MGRKRQTTAPFKGTAEQHGKLMAIIDEFRGVDGPLMPILGAAQELYGYVPVEVQTTIARELDMPLEKVYGVVSFYSQFSLNPKGKFKISVCMGTACYVKGAGEVFDKLKAELSIDNGDCTEDGLFSLDATRCLGCCGLAPVMTVNEDVYGKVETEQIKGILAKYKA